MAASIETATCPVCGASSALARTPSRAAIRAEVLREVASVIALEGSDDDGAALLWASEWLRERAEKEERDG